MLCRPLLFSLLCLTQSCISSSGKITELNLASYNIRHGEGTDKKLDLERTAQVLKELNADLIALQEVDKNCERSKKVDQAAFLGQKLGMHHHFEKFMNYQGGEYGMAVLSRYPLKKIIRHELPKGSEPRCALEIKVFTLTQSKPSLLLVFTMNGEKQM